MTHPVKEKLENGYGLFDMNGNVWEWVQEHYWESVFGGSWKDGKDSWSTSTSKGCNPNTVHNDVGFRIVSGGFYAKSSNEDLDIKDYEELSFEDLDNDFDDSDSYDEDSDESAYHQRQNQGYRTRTGGQRLWRQFLRSHHWRCGLQSGGRAVPPSD